MNVVPQLYPSDVKSAMFSRTLFSREHDLQLYSIAQWVRTSVQISHFETLIFRPRQCFTSVRDDGHISVISQAECRLKVHNFLSNLDIVYTTTNDSGYHKTEKH